MTIKDVARLAGVSVSTVSRVLNEHPDVSPPIREKVLDVVKEYHFIPNSTARNLVRPRRNCVGVICLDRTNPFYSGIITVIEEELNKVGYSMCLRFIGLDTDEVAYAAELERAERLQGIIFLGGRSDYTAAEIAVLTVPYVCCSYTNYFGDVPKSRFSSVTIDDMSSATKAVEYLYEMGHRQIALLIPRFENRSISELRYLGYCRGMEKLGLPVCEDHILYCDSFHAESGYEAVSQGCKNGMCFTALVAASDLLAISAIRALHELNVRVPEDCSLLGIDGLELARYSIPSITTFAQPQKELGAESVNLLIPMIREKKKGRHLLLMPTLRMGESVKKLD